MPSPVWIRQEEEVKEEDFEEKPQIFDTSNKIIFEEKRAYTT